MAGTIRAGNITIQRVIETEARFFKALEFFPSLRAERLEENRHWMQPNYLDPSNDALVLCVQSHVVRTAHHNILIDTCVGNHKDRPMLPPWSQMASDRYETALAATGLSVNDIDYVMCTHLHVDHVGWNTRLENGRWVPTFPRARYLFAEGELAYWNERQKIDPTTCPWIEDSVLPIIAANQADIVGSDHRLGDDVVLIPTPGHTVDHYSVLVGKPGADAFVTGDMVHSPLQGRYPDLGMMADYDSAQAGLTRHQIFDRFCETSTIVCANHFPSPDAARIERWGETYRFVSA